MKVKLLKKIRKRYEWKYGINSVFILDKKDQQVYKFPSVRDSLYYEMGAISYGWIELMSIDTKKKNLKGVRKFNKL